MGDAEKLEHQIANPYRKDHQNLPATASGQRLRKSSEQLRKPSKKTTPNNKDAELQKAVKTAHTKYNKMHQVMEKEDLARAYKTLTNSSGWGYNDGIWNKTGFKKTPPTSYAYQFQDPWKLL